MEIHEVTAEEYSKVIPKPYHVFGSGEFAALNANKADDVYYLLFRDSKYRLGLTAGIRNKTLHSPFSAPFGGLVYLNQDVRISYIDDTLDTLIGWSREKGLDAIRFTLPPPLYNECFIAKQTNALYRKGFAISQVDLNYSFDLNDFSEDYERNIWRNARKNLAIALASNLSFFECESLQDKERAYEIIRQNRSQRGFPLRMTWEQVKETIAMITADFYLVHTSDQKAIAAAVVFHMAMDIVQVIYWGDLPDYAHLKTMNFLSYRLFDHYKTAGKRIVDIGTSTENSLPNHGLCEFKESIGSSIQQKLSFQINLYGN